MNSSHLSDTSDSVSSDSGSDNVRSSGEDSPPEPSHSSCCSSLWTLHHNDITGLARVREDSLFLQLTQFLLVDPGVLQEGVDPRLCHLALPQGIEETQQAEGGGEDQHCVFPVAEVA